MEYEPINTYPTTKQGNRHVDGLPRDVVQDIAARGELVDAYGATIYTPETMRYAQHVINYADSWPKDKYPTNEMRLAHVVERMFD